jgi:putative membrane protein
MTNDPPGDPRVYFAAERTLLAWVRTGLALMGFGFVVARFGLFLHELSMMQKVKPPARIGISLWVGLSLVALGVAVNIVAALQNWRTIRRLQRNETLEFRAVSFASLVAMALAILGLVVGGLLLINPGH